MAVATTPVTRPDETRLARLARVADAYAEWAEVAIPDAPFHPEDKPVKTVYNQHYQDIESSGEEEDRLAEMLADEVETAATVGGCGCGQAHGSILIVD